MSRRTPPSAASLQREKRFAVAWRVLILADGTVWFLIERNLALIVNLLVLTLTAACLFVGLANLNGMDKRRRDGRLSNPEEWSFWTITVVIVLTVVARVTIWR
jgi:magnesium-transporting ATPase (P-type)